MKLTDITKIPKVLGAGTVTYDGFVIDSQFTAGYDAAKFGAMAARIVGQVKKSLRVEEGAVILYTSNIVFIARARIENVFFTICSKDANLGLIKIKMDKVK
jgi:predicted regulator of Ras-like GTPase activity (Roadblock/LC7/MglB family)